MPDLVDELQRLITLAGAEPEAATGQFDVLVAIHGRLVLAEALTAVAPEIVAEALAAIPRSGPDRRRGRAPRLLLSPANAHSRAG